MGSGPLSLRFATRQEDSPPHLCHRSRWLGQLCHPRYTITWPVCWMSMLPEEATNSRPLRNDSRYRYLPSRAVLIPAGDDFRRLRKLYGSLMDIEQSGILHVYQDLESLFLLRRLLEDPQSFLFECGRFAINVLFKAIYTVRLDKDKVNLIREIYEL